MRFSIIMPVLNEETVLDAQLAAICRVCAGCDYELLIIDGGSCDRTVEIGNQYGHVVHTARGRARQMNAGARTASGDILLFLHADTQLPARALTLIEQALRQPGIVAGAFRLHFDSEHWPYRLIEKSINLRSYLRRSFTGDQAYFMPRTRFWQVGGYPEQPLMEDIEIMHRLRRHGKIVLLAETVTTSVRRHEEIGLLRSISLMWCLRVLYSFGVSSARLQRLYKDIR